MPKPKLSIIIPTCNRKDLLVRLLDSLDGLKADFKELEVWVVDDGSSDGTAEALAQRQDPFPLQLLRQQSQGPSAARNRGAAEAQGEILGFLDSDVTVHPKWWQAARPHFDQAKTAAVEGSTLLPPGSGRPTPFTNFVFNDRGGSFQTCNLLCRRGVFKELGGFDERYCLRLASGRILHNREDSDLAFSILKSGRDIIFEPRAIVWHPLPEPFHGLYFLKARHGLQEALLRHKHPEMYRRRLKWIDGRVFPVFYWGIFLGLPLVVGGILAAIPILAELGAIGFLLGWAGSFYAPCWKRRTRIRDAALLAAQMLVIPWLRLGWVLCGEWKFRKVREGGRLNI